MRVVLRDIETGRFLRSPDDWTEDRVQAMNFPSGWQAVAYAREHKLHDLEVLLTSADPQHDDTFRLL